MQTKENKMGVMPIDKLLISMSLPMMISMLVQALYNIVDSIFVSRINEYALRAVSLAFPIQSLMIAVAVGTAVGINAFLSKTLGEKDFEKADIIAQNGIFLAIASYVAFAVIGLLVSQLLQVLLELLYLKPYLWAGNDAETVRTEEDFDAFRGIFVPGILLIPSAVTAKSSYRWLGSCFSDRYAILYLAAAGMIFCMIYLAGLLLTGGITLSFLQKRNPSAVSSHQR